MYFPAACPMPELKVHVPQMHNMVVVGTSPATSSSCVASSALRKTYLPVPVDAARTAVLKRAQNPAPFARQFRFTRMHSSVAAYRGGVLATHARMAQAQSRKMTSTWAALASMSARAGVNAEVQQV